MFSKKLLILALVLVLTLSFVLVGCGSGDYEDFDLEEGEGMENDSLNNETGMEGNNGADDFDAPATPDGNAGGF